MKTITIDGVDYQLTPIATEAPKPVQWEPKQLDENEKFWSIGGTGTVFSSYNINPSTGYERTSFGNYFHTEQEAEEVAKQVRQLLRLRAYVREFAPDWEADWSECKPDWRDSSKLKWHIYFDESCKEWSCSNNQFMHSTTVVYMPENVAKELADKLNSGEVVL